AVLHVEAQRYRPGSRAGAEDHRLPQRPRAGRRGARGRRELSDHVAAAVLIVRILHAIHDFLPRHQAGSELYAFELCRALAARHDVTVLCADFNPAREHGTVRWRVHDGLPVAEVVKNWPCFSFEGTYRPPHSA